MNRSSIYISALLFTVLCPLRSLNAQENGAWDLKRCIDYATEHNLTVKSKDISLQQNQLDLSTAKFSRLPDLSASASQNFSFGRGLSEANTYVNTNTASTSFSLGASLNVFNGFRVNKTIKLNALNLEAATADLEKARDDIRIQVVRAYVQILYNQEIMKVAQSQVAIDSAQVERLRAMFSTGKASAAEVARQEASLGQSRLTLTQAANSLELSLLDLTQLLELPSPEGFKIQPPDTSYTYLLPAGGPDIIYEEALGIRPAIKAEESRLKASDVNIAIAKSAWYPSISLSGGLGTNYYVSKGYPAASFWNQLSNNFSQYVGISLNIPIFHKMATKNSVKGAKLSRLQQQSQFESVRKGLYKEIQQAWYNAIAAQSKFVSCSDALSSAELSFELTQAEYENGKANVTEFNESKNALMKAQSDLLQARYEYMFNTKLLDFYRGSEIQ